MRDIKLPINFNSPYKTLNIQDFWRRWHITLGRFLRDYIYIPLGGNRTGKFRNYLNLLITFLIAGIWHGASWMFVFWGFLHGVAMVVHRAWKELGFTMNKYLAWFITFNFINISWIFFRAKDWDSAMKVLDGMFNFNNIMLPERLSTKLSSLSNYGITFGPWLGNIGGGKTTILMLLLGFILIIGFKNSIEQLRTFEFNYKTMLISAFAFVISVLSLTKISEFLYFNF